MSTIQVNEMSLAQLAAVYNALGEAIAVEGFKPVKSVPSKAKGIEKVEALIEDRDVTFDADENGEITFEVGVPVEDEPVETEGDEPAEEPADEGEEEGDEPADAPADAPFVKATKDELAAMDAATRADYRKRRRAAARALRKAAQA